MSKAVLKLDGVDFSGLIARGGLSVDYEIRSGSEIVTLDGTLYTFGVEKVKLTVTMREMPFERVRALQDALGDPYVNVTYQDPKNGVLTKSFAVSNKSADVKAVSGGRTYYDGVSFTLRER